MKVPWAGREAKNGGVFTADVHFWCVRLAVKLSACSSTAHITPPYGVQASSWVSYMASQASSWGELYGIPSPRHTRGDPGRDRTRAQSVYRAPDGG